MIDIAAIKARADKATSGPWESDATQNEGDYGSGPDCVSGFSSYEVIAEKGRICDTINSDVAMVCEEYDEDGCTAFDEVGQANMDFIAHARTDIPALIAALEAVQAILESDRTRIIDGVNGLSDALRRRQWLLTSRGSYEWDDARFIQEFRDAIDEIDKAVEPLRSIGADKSNCPQTTAEVIQARVDLIAALEASESARVKAEQERDALKEALKPFADEAFRYEPDDGDSDLPIWDCQLTLGNLRDARRTLEAKP